MYVRSKGYMVIFVWFIKVKIVIPEKCFIFLLINKNIQIGIGNRVLKVKRKCKFIIQCWYQ